MVEYLEKFSENLLAVGGSLHTITINELGTTLSGLFKKPDNVIVHTKVEKKYSLSQIWKENNIVSELEIFDPEKENAAEWKNKISKIENSISMPVSIIAFTGTVVLTSKFENSRLLSLLPKRQVVIGHVDQMVWEMKDFWEKFGNKIEDIGSNLFFITGPSRTADIEKIIVKGAHGPAVFDVILITN